MRKTSIIAGVMFIVATAAGVAGLPFLAALNAGGDLMTNVAAHGDQLAIGAVLEAVMGLACAGIAISLYPAVREFDPGLALGSVGFRVAECTLFLMGSAALLALVALSTDAAVAGTTGSVSSSGALLKAVSDKCGAAAALPFSVGALLYYYAFFRTRMIPRWLSCWGLISIGLCISIATFAMISRTNENDYALLLMPIFFQEMVLAVWLIAKGFGEPVVAAAARPAKR
jgi:hypothetical protein